jgi:ATP-dependent helicase/nuclease subunit A
VTAAPVWQRARAAESLQIEVPFAVVLSAAEYAELAGSIGVTPAPGAATAREIVEGVVDLAFRENGRWTIVDYKSDAAGGGIDEPRRAKYRAQVDLYAAAWERITGEPVRERVLLFTADGAIESW